MLPGSAICSSALVRPEDTKAPIKPAICIAANVASPAPRRRRGARSGEGSWRWLSANRDTVSPIFSRNRWA